MDNQIRYPNIKIRPLEPKPTTERTCSMCGKTKQMTKFQRFCSESCRKRATYFYKNDGEFQPHFRVTGL